MLAIRTEQHYIRSLEKDKNSKEDHLDSSEFLRALQGEVVQLVPTIASENGSWIVKGFIDLYKRIYAMPSDTKVISKVLELFLLPKLADFAERNGYSAILAEQQNFYPDISFVSRTDPVEKYAVDIKSTYRVDDHSVNGMTLGAFTGYFRDRTSRKNCQFPYAAYRSHIVLGVIYSKTSNKIVDPINPPYTSSPLETTVYSFDDLERIESVIHDLIFFVQPKYRIATARPGSGNTRNIGSVTVIAQLVNGKGPFAELGEDVYDDYWMNYLNVDMARKIGSSPSYNNLTSYVLYKNKGRNVDLKEAEKLDKLDTGNSTGNVE